MAVSLINDYAPLLLRICLVVLFPFSGLDKIVNWNAAMRQAGALPFKPVMLVASIIVEFATPVCIVTGWHDRGRRTIRAKTYGSVLHAMLQYGRDDVLYRASPSALSGCCLYCTQCDPPR